MLSFKEYLAEAEKSEFESRLRPSSNGTYTKRFNHNKTIGGMNVHFQFDEDEPHSHTYDLGYTVAGLYGRSKSKEDALSPEHKALILHHAGDVVNSFVKHFKPKGIHYSAFDHETKPVYDRLSKKLAGKYNGTVEPHQDSFYLKFPEH